MAEPATGVMVLGGEGGDDISLLEILDHVLNQGVVIHGTIIISLAGVDLIYLGLNIVLTGIETARQAMEKQKSLQQPKSTARPRERR
jgi:hypothetical protein